MQEVVVTLKDCRLQHGLTQRELAARSGLRIDTISALERGRSRGIAFETLARLSEALECRPGDLLDLVEDDHEVPILGGPDEDDLIRRRLADPSPNIDGPTFFAELLKRSRRRHTA